MCHTLCNMAGGGRGWARVAAKHRRLARCLAATKAAVALPTRDYLVAGSSPRQKSSARRGTARLVNSAAGERGTARTVQISRALRATTSMMALGLAMVTSTPLHAQSTSWTGSQSTDWFAGVNWMGGLPNTVPNPGLNAVIDTVTPNPTVVDAFAVAQANNLTVGDAGTGRLTIQNSGTVRSVNGIVGRFGNSIGTVTVDGAGSSWINSGELAVGAGGTGTLTIRNGGAVRNPSGVVGDLNGATGTVTVDGAGSTWTNSVLVVGRNGNGTLTIENGGAVSNTSGVVGDLNGSTGTVTVDGAGSSWTNSASLRVGDRGTGTLTIRNGGAVSASDVTIAANGGSIGAINIGAASGQPAAAPGTLNAPSVQFGSGTGRIVFNHTAANYVFAPVISGGGSVDVEAGTTILTGANTYTGATTVNGGMLLVNDSIASSSGLMVNPGATVGGAGTLPSITINGGTLSPGNSIGTMSVAGDLLLNSAAIYLVEVSPSAADRIIVAGTASLAGTVQAVFQPGNYVARTYTILSANGGRAGTFDALPTTNLPASVTAALSYTSTGVLLNLTLGLGRANGLTRNHQAVGSAIDNAFNAGVPLTGKFVNLLNLTPATLPAALDQLSGKASTSTQSAAFRSMDLFLQMMLDPFVVGRSSFAGGPAPAFSGKGAPGSALASQFPTKEPPPTFEQRWTAWGGVYGGREDRDGDTGIGSHELRTNVWGLAAGADWRMQDSVLGVALSAGTTSFDLSEGLGNGDTDFMQVGLYGSTRFGAAYASAALAYGWHQVEHERTIAFAGSDTLKGEFDAYQLGGRIEAGWRQVTPWLSVTPYAALTAQQFYTPGYVETATAGGADFALDFTGRTAASVRSEIGAWLDQVYVLDYGGLLTLRGCAAWLHDYSDDPVMNAAFPVMPGAAFSVIGATAARDALLASAASELELADGLSFIAKFDGEFAENAQAYSGTATLRRVW